MTAVVLDGALLLGHLDELSACGRTPCGGVTRLAWSAEDTAARGMVTGWLGGTGVRARLDAVGNLIAELPGQEAGLAPLAIGSHLDTVVDGGRLDGAYGTVAAFEIIAALAACGERLRHPLRAVAWANEEGVTAPPFTGSRAAAGMPVDLEAIGPDGRRLCERIAQAGGDPACFASAAWDSLAGYLELHIEQGPVLDQLAVPIGVVTGITGARRGWVRFEGQANHAGTTPMHLRADALLAAAHAVLAVERLATDGPASVATSGVIQAHPGNANVVAGRSAVSFDIRSMDEAALDAAVSRLRSEVDRIAALTGTTADLAAVSSAAAVQCHPALRSAVSEACASLGQASTELASGAGHDAQHLARLGPVGMIFVPSVGGISHHPAERTNPDHLIAGANVLLAAVRLADERLDP
jgi:hydantoinase/carbamoylase family amidase